MESFPAKAPSMQLLQHGSPLHLQPHEDDKVKGNSHPLLGGRCPLDKFQYGTYWATYRNIGLVAWVFSMFELAWTVFRQNSLFVQKEVLERTAELLIAKGNLRTFKRAMLSVRYVLKYNILSNISKYWPRSLGIFNVRNVVEGLDPKAPPCSCSYQNSPLHLQPHEDQGSKVIQQPFARATLSVG